MINDLPRINELTRRRVKRLLERFCDDPASHNYGGYVDDATGYACTRNSVFEFQDLFAAYLYPDFPEYRRSADLLAKLRMHLEFLKRRQYPDGSIALWASGVGGGNEIGFTLPAVCETYRRVAASTVPGRDELLPVLEHYIVRGASAVRSYFPYTSNHRWTACAGPLAVVNSLFPDPRNAAVIEDYLSDGIDLDKDGLYSEERSPGYSLVANWGLLYLADYWGRTDLVELIARNLRFLLAMRQPCGETETLFSHRQDRGCRGARADSYYLFKRLALETNDGAFASAADEALAHAEQQGLDWQFIPWRYLFDDPRLAHDQIQRRPLPDTVELRLAHTPIWRYRRREVATTVVADKGGHWFELMNGTWGGVMRSDAFLSFHVGGAIIDAMKIRWGTGTGSFRPESIEYRRDGSMRLFYRDPGWPHVAHYRPQSKWGPRPIACDQECEVVITRSDDAFLVQVRVGGWAAMPINIQWLLRETNTLLWPDGTATPLQHGAQSFSAGAGSYCLSAPDGPRLGLEGIPASVHKISLGDSARTITGDAERRCHRLIAGLFTPVDFTFGLRPWSAPPPSGSDQS